MLRTFSTRWLSPAGVTGPDAGEFTCDILSLLVRRSSGRPSAALPAASVAMADRLVLDLVRRVPRSRRALARQARRHRGPARQYVGAARERTVRRLNRCISIAYGQARRSDALQRNPRRHEA